MREQVMATSPLRRIGELEHDVAPLMLFLSSADSAYVARFICRNRSGSPFAYFARIAADSSRCAFAQRPAS